MNKFDALDALRIIKKKQNMSHILRLFALAFSDGFFHENEKELIFKIASKYGISSQELGRMLQSPETIPMYQPIGEEEKSQQLTEMIQLITVDDELHENEIALCKYYAREFGINEELFDSIIANEQSVIYIMKRLYYKEKDIKP